MGHPFDELQLKKRFCLSKSVPFLVEIAWVSLLWVTLSTVLASELKVFGSALRCTLAVDRARRDDPAGGMPLRQLTKVRIQFAASDQRSAAVREFLKRCQAARESSPECVLEHRV